MPDPLQVLTLLARLYDDQSEDDPRAEFNRGAAHALRLAAQIIVGPEPGLTRRSTGRRSGQQSGGTARPPAAPPAMQLAVGSGSNGRAWPDGQDRPHVCECGASYALPQHLGLHRKKVHGVPSQRSRRRNQTPA